MRVVIAGSRDIHDYALLERAILASGFAITEVVSGTQRGVDQMGERWSREVLHKRPKRYPPENHTAPALRDRNRLMSDYADCLICIPGPASADHGNGSLDMIEKMRVRGKPVHVPELEG